MLTKRIKKILTAIAQEWYKVYQTNTESNILQNRCTAANFSPQRPNKLDEQAMRDTAEGIRKTHK